ncbi:MAG: hypothetical protein COV09_01980 [Candidatus Vogelbacteria bacterium CG10_big_fil_rev_8_21_14_0_10_50_13]|uniref:GlxA-like beta barrel domain-containing protein n=1 Tax=Candidatus Vogelbacteria bacterium CG10_big_fil_rev_8_21_14_0_10_50_13 TaxID=1975044 RepID=A0A2H0RFY6_9BACT|nr:MAG: hypothetical protein COV09_01980 [Candidatus Vogelbacteria bacterium CG10_big_fil_rev_8_21_14_0_10_50_13]
MPDIIRNRRSLKEVLPRDIGARTMTNHLPTNDSPPPRPKNIDWHPRRRFGPKFLVTLIVLVILIFGGVAVTGYFSKSTIKVIPVQGRLLLNHTFDAYREAPEGELNFSLVSDINDTEKKAVPASGTETVSRKANGLITIYNNHNEQAQKLVANTRFETPDGKIFRIQDQITVPGAKLTDGQQVPGSIEVRVYADQAGSVYNIGPAEFTIPGFKGDPRFDKFYARSTAGMTGGFEGQIKKVSEADKAEAILELKEILKGRLLAEAKTQSPANFILFDDAYFITYEEVLNETLGENASVDQAEVALRGTFYGILFNREDLSFKVAEEQIPNFNGRPLLIKNLDQMKFALLNREEITGPEVDQISFTLEGNAHLVWQFNQEEMITKLSQAPKDSYQAIFAQFPSIKEASLSFFPPWSNELPDNRDRIKVEIITTD